MNGSIATLVSVIAGVAAILTAVGGVLLVIRTVRSRERIALTKERNQVEHMLETERKERVAAELRAYHLELLLAEHGVAFPSTAELPETKAIELPETKAIESPKQEKTGESD